MTEKRALLLVGSPRGFEKSTSGRLGTHLLDTLKARGLGTEKVHVHAAVRSPDALESALAAVAAADLVILSLPLYVDSFPAPVIAFLENVAERRTGAGRAGLFLLIQCGFPESEQNATALAIAERFAAEVGWRWLGALALGGAENYGSSPNEVLVQIGKALAEGKPAPYLASKKAMPAWLYRVG
ncbi:MAG: NAD(P)H-dependent oxidoreductase, partial [Candidatus Bipolaricaulota bacterium]|nr:NAD(P)H-dependent oxidoreductase [Candidatus Bipolaricaulota bacterium]